MESIEKVLSFFEEISKIPRGSGKEKKISDYLVNFAKERNLEVYRDEALNVIIKKEASKGYENYEPLIIQGHMDMVWEKNKETEFDFEKEGIITYVEDGWMKAKGTTLGADNGIAVAYALELLDGNYSHPKLEVLITTDEEAGMTGASAIDMSLFSTNRMINLDTEEDDKIYVSSAGGSRVQIKLEFEKERVDIADKIFKLEITGLKGGHSGAEIHKRLGNSIKILTELLDHIKLKYIISIIEINGGDKNNAIPREAEVIFTTPDAEYKYLNEEIKMICEILNYGLENDEKIVYKLEEIENRILDKKLKITHLETVRLLKFLKYFPNGVKKMSDKIDGLVQTSNNLGVIRTKKENNKIVVYINSLLRSSDNNDLKEMENDIVLLSKKFDGVCEIDSSYKAWEYKEDSEIRKIFEKAFKDVTGEKVEIAAIHAGLECGLFVEKNSNLDVISMGPNIQGAHTPDERIELKSIEKIWNILLVGLRNYDIK